MKIYKKVILYKLGRYQEDFEYIFPNIKIEKYITDKKISNYNNKKCICIKDLNKKQKTIIVICDRKNNKITKQFDKLKFKEYKDYIFLEDFAKILDQKTTIRTRILDYLYKKYKKESFEPYCLSNSEMFKKMIYTDAQDSFKCLQPFEYAQIQKFGFVFPCCEGWALENIGNILYSTPKKVWNSTRARIYRLSIINKTYSFCSFENCPYLNKKIKQDIRFEDLEVKKTPKRICIAFDDSCNLKCKSCRNCFLNNNHKKKYIYINNNIIKKLKKSKWLNNSEHLIMASNGEVFFSKFYKKILFSDKITKRDSICIHTNGTLLTKKILDKLCSKYKDISFFISLDACTQETYKKLRFGGNFNILKRNLEYISQAKKEGKIKYVSILFVLQSANYKELIDTAKLAIKLNFDRLDVTKIMNWGTFTEEEFKKVSMFDENDKPKKELIEVLKNPIFDSKDIEFWGNVLTKKK